MCEVSNLAELISGTAYTVRSGTEVSGFLFWIVYFFSQSPQSKSLLKQLHTAIIHFNYIYHQLESSVSFSLSILGKLIFKIQAQKLTLTLAPPSLSVQSILIPRDQRSPKKFTDLFYECFFRTQFEILLQVLNIDWSTGHIFSCINGT